MLDGLVGLVVLDGLIIQARPDQTTVMRDLGRWLSPSGGHRALHGKLNGPNWATSSGAVHKQGPCRF